MANSTIRNFNPCKISRWA